MRVNLYQDKVNIKHNVCTISLCLSLHRYKTNQYFSLQILRRHFVCDARLGYLRYEQFRSTEKLASH